VGRPTVRVVARVDVFGAVEASLVLYVISGLMGSWVGIQLASLLR
jgi:hypothetical protein